MRPPTAACRWTHHRRRGVLAGIAVILLASALVINNPDAINPSPSPDQGTAVRPVRLGPTAGRAEVEFTVTLAVSRPQELRSYLEGLHTPVSPYYRKYLSAHEYGERFGLSDEQIERVQSWLVAGGLHIVKRYPQRTALRVRGRASEVNALLGVELNDFSDPVAGTRFHSPAGTPAVPDRLAGMVDGITGLDTRSKMRPYLQQPQQPDVEGLTPAEVAKAYGITPLHDAGYDGRSQFVAIVSFDSVRDSDIATWDQRMGINALPIEHIKIGGGTDVGDGTAEVALDVEIIRGIAPQARILNFEAPNGGASFGDIIDAIVSDGRARVVSISWGNCDSAEFRAKPERERDQRAFQAAATAGINVFVASGDSGAYSCRHEDSSDHRITGDWPSDSPYVVAVGGTFLSLRKDGTYFDEAGWEEPLSEGGTGGGLSPVDERPSWQRGPGVDNRFSNGKRQFPDVAATADCASAHYIYYTDPESGPSEGAQGCGTSASAPLWAGMTALFQQLAEREGVAPIGFLNPILYRLAADNPPNSLFHDVVRGGNLYHNATPGWDYATGLGTPLASRLAQQIVAFLRANPAAR